jgi:uncharacterized protein YciI
MRWIAYFTDTPEMLKVRRERQDMHFDYLKEHESEILIAGSCRETPDGAFVGGLWVLEVPNKERAVELIENDPYFNSGYRTYRLMVWGKAFDGRSVVL